MAMVAAVTVWLSTGRDPAGYSGTSAEGAASPSAIQAYEVTEALRRLPTDPDSLVATGSREQVGQRARDGMPAGSTIEIDENSWAPDGTGGGVDVATVNSPRLPSVTYAEVMVTEDEQWTVAATMQRDEAVR
jgi:hypothetical protein